MRVLVLGASGMLGNAVVRVLSERKDWQVYGAMRSEGSKRFFDQEIAERLIAGVDVESEDALVRVLAEVRPDVVVNCIGLVKQLAQADDPLQALPINAMLPHRLARLSALSGARLIHMSTDCVFSGRKGLYTEEDFSDAEDLYGRSKYLGEVDYPNAVTLRTSIIGHELQSAHGLINWFISLQQGECKGYTRAVFSGLPTVELARVMKEFVIPNPHLRGVYHVSAKPIAKYDLLCLVAEKYGKRINIIPDDTLKIDRSLNSERFHSATGYIAPEWSELVERMYSYQ